MANKTWDGSTDGDWNTAANWTPSGVPGVGDDVRIPAGTPAIDAFDASGTAIGDFLVEEGYTNTIGSATADLQIDPDRFEFAGTGLSYIDVSAANIDILIKNTATAASGARGLVLIGSSMNVVSVLKGKVGIATVHNTTATCTDLRVLGGDVWAGEGCTLTNVEITGGKAELRCAATTIRCAKGDLTTNEEGAITTINLYSGSATLNSSGTITTLNIHGGVCDFTQSGISRTVTTLNLNPGGSLKYDPNVMTLSTISEADAPISISSSTI